MKLAEQQRAFAAHLRDPDRVPAPADIEPRRMAIYRELFFNNVVDLLGGAFPVARRILGTERWRRLIRGFYAGHHAHTPYFLELPREFAEWLRAREVRAGEEPAFLDELAHYEWVELALSVSEEIPPAAAAPTLSPLDQPLAVSPLAWPLAYRWPGQLMLLSIISKRPACDFSALASVSNQSAISVKPSLRAAFAMLGYISVYSCVSPATADARFFMVSPMGLSVAGSPTDFR
jgi:hypothetical protein